MTGRGDILLLAFDPASGREMKGKHFCLVVSPRAFNARFKLDQATVTGSTKRNRRPLAL